MKKQGNFAINVQVNDTPFLLSDRAVNVGEQFIETCFQFVSVSVVDLDIESTMIDLRLTLVKQKKLKDKGIDLNIACKHFGVPLAKKAAIASKVCKETKRNSTRIAFSDELYIYNSDFEYNLKFIFKNLSHILRESAGIDLKLLILDAEDCHCPFDKDLDKILNQIGFQNLDKVYVKRFGKWAL